MFWRRSREKSGYTSQFTLHGGSAAKEVPLAQESRQLRTLRLGAGDDFRRPSELIRVGAPSPLACFPLARPFFLAPTTSKRLLSRL